MPQFCVLFYVNYAILTTQRGGHGPMSPLNTPLITLCNNLVGRWIPSLRHCTCGNTVTDPEGSEPLALTGEIFKNLVTHAIHFNY